MTGAGLELTAADETAMVACGARLAGLATPGLVIFLAGELGMGKTTLARGFLRGRGHHGAVKSPTYTLVEPYALPGGTIYHFDLYRLGDPGELEYMGIRDYFDGDAICLVEWPERGAGVLPPADLVITIGTAGTGRRLALAAGTTTGADLVTQLRPDTAAEHRQGRE